MPSFRQSLSRLLLIVPLASLAAEDSYIGAGVVYTGITPLERPNPSYPIQALSKSEEGWVHISFIVTKDGDVSDAMIKDSSGNNDFEKAALNAINRWKFTPAKLGEEAVDSSETETILVFQLENNRPGASRPFIRKYNEINDMIASGNTIEFDVVQGVPVVSVEAKLTELRFTEKYNLYEDAWFWWLDSMYAQRINDRKRMLASVEKALTAGDRYLPTDIYVQASQLAYALNVDIYNFQDAFDHLDKLKKSKEAQKAANYNEVLAALEAHALKIRAIVNGPETIMGYGEIADNAYWFHKLSRNVFSLGEVQGKIASVEIRCNSYQVRRYEYVADVEWTIPSSWKNCSVYVRGDVGTTFKFYEFPR